MDIRKYIEDGRAIAGIEFGSTRIKAVLIDEEHKPIAMGSCDWENRLENGYWTYSLEDIINGMQSCYKSLKENVEERYSVKLKKLGGLGISAMMHGYMAFDRDNNLLVPFRTWRNINAAESAAKLSESFDFNIPDRWSIAHLYQAVLDKEEHLSRIASINTLSGYIHYRLSGERVLGTGDASGMFPISGRSYDKGMAEIFNGMLRAEGLDFDINKLLPEVRSAGEYAGRLSAEGAKLLDPDGELEAGTPLCPPEGDAGTGMVATDAVAPGTGNVSAGTSVFAMIVLDKPLSKRYREIDMVSTPDGYPVAMVHANNCTSDLNAWVNIFREYNSAAGISMDTDRLYGILYNEALSGDRDCGGLLSYGYFSGESMTGIEGGRPLFVRRENASFTLANFMRSHLYTALGALKLGMDILTDNESIRVDNLFGHGGFFKTEGVGQRIMAAAMNMPVSVMETAGEGGPWGQAVLAAYMLNKESGESLSDYLNSKVFFGSGAKTVEPECDDVEGFKKFMELYRDGLDIERTAVSCI